MGKSKPAERPLTDAEATEISALEAENAALQGQADVPEEVATCSFSLSLMLPQPSRLGPRAVPFPQIRVPAFLLLRWRERMPSGADDDCGGFFNGRLGCGCPMIAQ